MEKLDAPESPSVPSMLLLNENAMVSSFGEDELPHLVLPEAKQRRERPSAVINPSEGFCVKCRVEDLEKSSDFAKVFINMMSDDAIPPPSEPLASISDAGLAELLEEGTDDSTAALRIPMSLGAPRMDKDKGGEECRVCDVVINSAFFRKADASLIMKTFLVTVTLDGLEQKYNVCLNRDNWVILKNKKFFGTKVPHTVRDCPVKELNEPVVEILQANESSGDVHLKERGTKKTTTDADSLKGGEKGKVKPKFVIRRVAQNCICATVQLPDAAGVDDVDFQMNDDRMVVRSPEHSLDIFLPLPMDFEKCTAEFDVKERVLQVFIPLRAK